MGQTKSRPLYLKSRDEIARMRKAGILLHRVMKEVCAACVEGTTGLELDKLAYARIKEAGAKPAFLRLYGFPNTLCISVNDAVVHGVPTRKKYVPGDIVSIDCGLALDGFYSDMAWTVPIHPIPEATAELLRVTEEALYVGIAQAKVGNRVGMIGAAIEEHIGRYGFHAADGYTGHGIGRYPHEEPKVLNTGEEQGRRMQPGLVIAIEPMVNVGTAKTKELSDGWTVLTEDGTLSAHYEHTVAVTEDGPYVLTVGEGANVPVPAMAGHGL